MTVIKNSEIQTEIWRPIKQWEHTQLFKYI